MSLFFYWLTRGRRLIQFAHSKRPTYSHDCAYICFLCEHSFLTETALGEHYQTHLVTVPVAGSATINTSAYTVEDPDFRTFASPQRTISGFDEESTNGVYNDAFGPDTPCDMVQIYRSSAQLAGSARDIYTNTHSYIAGVESTHQEDVSQSLSSRTDFDSSLAGAYYPKGYDSEMTMNTSSTSLSLSTHRTYPSSESPAQTSTIIQPLASNTGSNCTCIACIIETSPPDFVRETRPCILPSCEYKTLYRREWTTHVKKHFLPSDRFPCNAPDCKIISVRWSDFLRHCKSSHCRRPQIFPCDVLGCKYGGDNGFPRKDKLMSHKRNVHEGKAVPRKQPRVIKPKKRE